MRNGRTERRRPLALRRRVRGSLRRVFPALPVSALDLRTRLRGGSITIGRLTAAAVIAYLLSDVATPGTRDLTAPLTALLVVQVSTIGTVLMGLVRVGAVLTGVLLAVAVSAAVGLSGWSLALVVAASLVLARVFRLGEQSLETPISAMLILAVASPQSAAEVRVLNTVIGTGVGVLFSLLLPVAIPNRRAGDAVRRVARSQAALLDEVAVTLGDRTPLEEESQAWFDWVAEIDADLEEAGSAVRAVEEARRLNPRALTTSNVEAGLRAAHLRMARALAGVRALLDVLAREAPQVAGTRGSGDLRQAFAVVLDDLADAFRAFGDVVGADADGADEALARALDILRETRAVLTELTLLDVDPADLADRWVVQGSVLAAVDQVLGQLDLERGEPVEAWATRRAIPALRVGLLPVGRVLRGLRRPAGVVGPGTESGADDRDPSPR